MNVDELELVARLREVEPLPPDVSEKAKVMLRATMAVAEDTEAQLASAQSTLRTAGGRDRSALRATRRALRSRRSRLFVGATAAAGAIAVALVATVAVPGPSGHVSAAAAAVLNRAAGVAAAQPPGPTPGPGQYLYVKTLEANSGGVSGNGWSYDFVNTDTKQQWIATDGSGRVVITPGTSVNFLTPADEVAWAKSGNPIPTPAGSDQTYPMSGPDGTLDYPDAANLPTDPGALETAIAQQYNGGQVNPGILFYIAGNFLQEGASPQLRAALYQMIEQLPGIESLGPMTDLLGRQGVAVGFAGGGKQEQLIFDPSTSAVLEYRNVVVSPTRANSSPYDPNDPNGIPAGTVLSYTVYVSAGVVNSTTSTSQPASSAATTDEGAGNTGTAGNTN